jgi:hypothetical protein
MHSSNSSSPFPLGVLAIFCIPAIAATIFYLGRDGQGGAMSPMADTLRTLLARWVEMLRGVNVWKALAILFALGNLKNLPFVWHVRRPLPSFPSPQHIKKSLLDYG